MSVQITLIHESIREREADDESTLVSCRLFSWPAFGGISELMMPQQWWMAAVAVPSAVSIIMTREREEPPTEPRGNTQRCSRLSEGSRGAEKSREVNYYLFWEDKTGFRRPSDWLSLINTWINTVFIMSTNRSLDRLILSKHHRTVS